MNKKQEFIDLINKFGIQKPHKKKYADMSLELLHKFDDNTVFFRDCFEDGHFTGSVLVVNKNKTKVLLMHHVKLGTWQHFWGHADWEIDIRSVAIRELEEEAWILETDVKIENNILSIDVHSVPARKWEPTHYHYDITFLGVVDEKISFQKQDSEVHDIKWFDIDDVLLNLDWWKYSSGMWEVIQNI